MVWIEFKRFIVPFFIAVFQVLTAALAIGMLPALWILFRERRWITFLKWGLITAFCVTALVYALPLALREWKDYVHASGFRYSSMWMGYAITALFAPMLIPEPFRIARRRVRKDRPEEKVRRRRRKRRSQQLPGEIKIR
jgi:hypothetical protein